MQYSSDFFNSPQFLQDKRNQATSRNLTSDSNSQLLQVIYPESSSDTISGQRVNAPHLMVFGGESSKQNNSSPALWSSSKNSHCFSGTKLIEERGRHNIALHDLEKEIQNKIKKMRVQQTSQKKTDRVNITKLTKTQQSIVNNKGVITEQTNEELNIQQFSSHLKTARTDYFQPDQQSDTCNKDNDKEMIDQSLERTPAFRREVEFLEKQLLKKIKVCTQLETKNKCQHHQTPEPKQATPIESKTAKKRISQEQINELIRLIKFGPLKKNNKTYDENKRQKTQHVPKKTLSESGQNLKPKNKSNDIENNRDMDKNNNISIDAYSHHQYRPISDQFFNRSINSPQLTLKKYNTIESKSDYAIRIYSKKTINYETDQLENLVRGIDNDEQICTDDQKNEETDAVENLVNQSVTDIQMGSAEADKKYGGSKNPIKLCRQSFFETPKEEMDCDNGHLESQTNNNIQINPFKYQKSAVHYIEKTENSQIQRNSYLAYQNEEFYKQQTKQFNQKHIGDNMNMNQFQHQDHEMQYFDEQKHLYEDEQQKMNQQFDISTPQQAFRFFEQSEHRQQMSTQEEFSSFQQQNDCTNSRFSRVQNTTVQRRRLMQLYGCTDGTIATDGTQADLRFFKTGQLEQRQNINPRVNMKNVKISKFDSCTNEINQVEQFNQQQMQNNNRSVQNCAQPHQFQSNNQTIQLNQGPNQIDSDINHKDDQKVVITSQSRAPNDFHTNHPKIEVQRRLDFESVPNCDESDELRQQAMNQAAQNKKYFMPQMPNQNVRDFNKFGNFEILKNRLQSMNQQNTSSSEKNGVRGHNLDMRMQTDNFRPREYEMMHPQGQYRTTHFTDSNDEMSNPRTPPYAKISRQRLDDQRQEYFTGVGSFMTQPSTNHQPSNFNPRQQMGRPANDQYQYQAISPYNQKYHNNSGNRQNYGVSRFIRRGTTPHEQNYNTMSSQYMMPGQQNSQRKTMRSAINEQHYHNFGGTSGSQKQKLALRPSTSSDNLETAEGDIAGPGFQIVRPFESQHKDTLNSIYDGNQCKMPNIYKSQTPNRSKQISDQDHQEMIIPKDFSNQKFPQNSIRGGKIGQPTISSFGSIIGGDSQVEPQELSNHMPTSRTDSQRNYWQHHQYLESLKSMQAHRAMVKKCPKHGENGDWDDYKETMALMAAQAHAYAQSCFMYFQLMARLSKSSVEKNYFLHQQAIAGCMVHGPHGENPMKSNLQNNLSIPPPSLAQYPDYDPKAFAQYQNDDKQEGVDMMPPPHCMQQITEAPKCEQKEHAKHPQEDPQEDQAKDNEKSEQNQRPQVQNDEQKSEIADKPHQIENQEDDNSKNSKAPVNQACQDTQLTQQINEVKPVCSSFSHHPPIPPPYYHSTHKSYLDRNLRNQDLNSLDLNPSYMRPPVPPLPQIGGPQMPSHLSHGSNHNQPHIAPPGFPTPNMFNSGHSYLGGPLQHQRFMQGPNAPHPFFMQHGMQHGFKRNKRNRKDPDTMRYLMQEFKKDPTWSKETYQRVARETGLSESQVYKWGWDQKNKKNEDEDDEFDDDDENKADEDGNDTRTEKDDMELKLDLAISKVKINTDEMNHGILLPHNMPEATDTTQPSDMDNKKSSQQNNSSNTEKQNESETTLVTNTKLGKRQLADISNNDKQSSAAQTQASKVIKKRDTKGAHPKDPLSEVASKVKTRMSNSNATKNRYSHENIDPQDLN